MSPVHHSALPVPFVLAGKLDRRARPQSVDPRREIEVIGDQECLAAGEANDETLVPCALGIIPQHFRDDPVAADLNMTPAAAVCGGENGFVAAVRRLRTCGNARSGERARCKVKDSVLPGERIDDAQQADKGKHFSHSDSKLIGRFRPGPRGGAAGAQVYATPVRKVRQAGYSSVTVALGSFKISWLLTRL